MRQVCTATLLVMSLVSSMLGAVVIPPTASEIRYTGVVEQVSGPSGMELYRLKKSYVDSLNGGYWPNKNAGTQPGIVIEIKTASPTVIFNLSLNSSYEDRWARIYLYENGLESNTEQSGTGNNLPISGTNTSGGSSVWRCVLPAFRAQYFTGVTLEDGYSLEPLDSSSKKVYVSIGNSITHGVGQTASATPLSYSWQVAENLGYELFNMAVGGSKINSEVTENIVGLNPDLITILWGYNDVNAPWDLSQAMGAYDTLMTTLAQTYPNAKIVAIEQTYTTTTTGSQVPANSIGRLRAEQKAIIETLQASYSNIFLVNGLDYTDASSLSDIVHLNDQGAAALATGLITEIPGFTVTTDPLILSDTTIFRSEYEKVGDTLGVIPSFKNLIVDSSDLTHISVSATGSVEVTTEIADLRYETHSIKLMAEQVSGDTLLITIIDGLDYWLEQHGGLVQGGHLDMATNGDWATHNNLWGDGTAVAGTDYRIEMAYTGGLPESTLIVWDVPSEATVFGGASVWNYSNMLWGNRFGERDDLAGFPFLLSDVDSLVLDYDFITIHDEESHKVALNMFTTDADTLAPFDENRGDFFMVFDQKGTWIPPYPDTLSSDTTIMGASYILLHKEEVKNSNPYHLRRAIVKNSETVEKGQIDLKKLFERFNSLGYMPWTLSVPNIQFGVEVTSGLGAIRINSLSINAGGISPVSQSQLKTDGVIAHRIQGKNLIIQAQSGTIDNFTILNIQGRVIKQVRSVDAENVSVDISNLSRGFYVARYMHQGVQQQLQFTRR